MVCIGKCTCCVCCGVCAGVTVLILAVLIPIGIFVVAPKMTQGILDDAPIALTNATMLPCTNAYAENIITMEMNSSAPFAATMHTSNVTISTYMCYGGTDATNCDNATEIPLGWYMMPEMKLKHGTNHEQMTVSMKLTDISNLLNLLILPLTFYNKKVWLAVTADDISVTSMGLKVNKLKMRKLFTCSLLGTSSAVPEPQYCDGVKPGSQSSFGPEMQCTLGLEHIEETSTTTTSATTATFTTTTATTPTTATFTATTTTGATTATTEVIAFTI